MRLEPYIFFYGRCEEALAFYKDVFGGNYELQRVKDSPMADRVPPEARDGVMHAKFDGPGFQFMATDGPSTKHVNPDEGNISLSLEIEDAANAERLFAKLGEGGSVMMPFADAFWGGKFGVLTDKFGIEWMISAE